MRCGTRRLASDRCLSHSMAKRLKFLTSKLFSPKKRGGCCSSRATSSTHTRSVREHMCALRPFVFPAAKAALKCRCTTGFSEEVFPDHGRLCVECKENPRHFLVLKKEEKGVCATTRVVFKHWIVREQRQQVFASPPTLQA